MTGKYVLPSALPSQETFHSRMFSSLSLLFHTQNSAPEHDPSLGGALGGEQKPERGDAAPCTHLPCALHCSGMLSDHDSHTAWGAVQFYFTQRWTAFHANLFTAEPRFPAGVCQGCLKGIGTLATGFSIQWYSAKSMKDFAWQEQGVTPRPWLFSM